MTVYKGRNMEIERVDYHGVNVESFLCSPFVLVKTWFAAADERVTFKQPLGYRRDYSAIGCDTTYTADLAG
jgi:hypothetical protein